MPSREQQAWIKETLAVVRSQHTNYYSSYSDVLVHLDDLGPGIWRMLADAKRAGFALVGPHGGTIEIDDEPTQAVVDLGRQADGSVTITTALVHRDGQRVPVDALLIGDPAYGAVVSERNDLRLIPIDPPMDSSVQRLLAAGSVAIPEPDVTQFLTEFYPALSHRVTVTSQDGTVELPQIQPPRLGLIMSFEAGHTATIETAFLYPVGDESRVVRPEDPDDDPTRDFATERDLVRRLDVLDRVRGLRVPSPYGPRLTPVVTVRGLEIAELVEHVLTALKAEEGIEVILIGKPATYGEAAEAPLVTVHGQAKLALMRSSHRPDSASEIAVKRLRGIFDSVSAFLAA